MATCSPKRILHTKLGVGTADGTVGNLREVASVRGGDFFIFLLTFTNLYQLQLFAAFLIILFSINL